MERTEEIVYDRKAREDFVRYHAWGALPGLNPDFDKMLRYTGHVCYDVN